MLTLINSNRMSPLIAPIGLDYVATAARLAGVDTQVVDLALADDPDARLDQQLQRSSSRLIGITFRNVDDCFWPSATPFLPGLCALVEHLRDLSDAPIVLGGVGLSIFPARILEESGADYAVRGDGEQAVVMLYQALDGRAAPTDVPGLVWRDNGRVACNPPAWPERLSVPTTRDNIDNLAYLHRGGQSGVETKRGCPRRCIYCADPLAKGNSVRERDPVEVADEFESLAAQGIDTVHICDGEFNLPHAHALAVCRELCRRGLSERVRWYAYAAVSPFDTELAQAMKAAGCVGIDFTGDAGSDAMLASYAHPHRRADLARTVALCREHGLVCMVDLLLGGPGETPATVSETIDFLKEIEPDCVGASLGMRLYPGTPAARRVAAEGPLEQNPSIRRKYDGPIDLLRPTFFLSAALGERPAALVRERIGGDRRFFPPARDAVAGHAEGDHNYNDNTPLADAIARGQRGAYWDILRQL